MHKETFFIDGVDARSLGIYLQNPIVFSEAIPNVEVYDVSGRNGKLLDNFGNFMNRSATASCFCLSKDVDRVFNNCCRFLMSNVLYRRLETSNDPEHFWLARIERGPNIDIRNKVLAPFTILFDCMPQRFRKDGERTITLFEPGYIDNPGMPSKPIIKIYGNSSVSRILKVGSTDVDILNINESITLDSEDSEAYNEYGNANSNIQVDEFPIFENGSNHIHWEKDKIGGFEKIEIIPRWWDV